MLTFFLNCFSNWRGGIFWTLWMILVMGVLSFYYQETPMNFSSLGNFVVIWFLAGLFFTISTSLWSSRTK